MDSRRLKNRGKMAVNRVMRMMKYLIALWTAVAVYALASFFNGAIGLSAYEELSAERDRQRANMETLGLINETLENSKNALLYDRDTIAVHARELGFGARDEKFVRIVGLGGSRRPHTSPGQIVTAAKPASMSDRLISIISICAGLAVFAGILVADILNFRSDER
jgi:cell division protein FtsB